MIAPAVHSALSGYEAATRRVQTSANNIVNADSTFSRDGNGDFVAQPYNPVDTTQVTEVDGTVRTVDRPRDPGSVNVYNPTNAVADENGVAAYPNVDIAEEFVKMSIATYDAKANLSVIQVESRRLGDLLDIFS